MSVVDTNKIDGIGINKDGNKLILLITDHLDWRNEYEHLIQLQNKMNSYISFIEDQQYREIYPDKVFSSLSIEIHFMYELTSNCLKFIDVIKKQLADENVSVDIVVDKSGNS